MAGNEPIKDRIILVRGQDFIERFGRLDKDDPIPTGTTARIEITEGRTVDEPILHTWTATDITTDYVGFRIESDDCDDVDAGNWWRLMIRYPGTPNAADYCWRAGQIKRLP